MWFLRCQPAARGMQRLRAHGPGGAPPADRSAVREVLPRTPCSPPVWPLRAYGRDSYPCPLGRSGLVQVVREGPTGALRGLRSTAPLHRHPGRPPALQHLQVRTSGALRPLRAAATLPGTLAARPRVCRLLRLCPLASEGLCRLRPHPALDRSRPERAGHLRAVLRSGHRLPVHHMRFRAGDRSRPGVRTLHPAEAPGRRVHRQPGPDTGRAAASDRCTAPGSENPLHPGVAGQAERRGCLPASAHCLGCPPQSRSPRRAGPRTRRGQPPRRPGPPRCPAPSARTACPPPTLAGAPARHIPGLTPQHAADLRRVVCPATSPPTRHQQTFHFL